MAAAAASRLGGGSGGGGWRRSRQRWRRRGGAAARRRGGASGGGGGGAEAGDRKQLWKLVDGKPKMVFVKLGLTDGSSTQLVEGDLQAGDQLITEIQGLRRRRAKDRERSNVAPLVEMRGISARTRWATTSSTRCAAWA